MGTKRKVGTLYKAWLIILQNKWLCFFLMLTVHRQLHKYWQEDFFWLSSNLLFSGLCKWTLSSGNMSERSALAARGASGPAKCNHFSSAPQQDHRIQWPPPCCYSQIHRPQSNRQYCDINIATVKSCYEALSYSSHQLGVLHLGHQ